LEPQKNRKSLVHLDWSEAEISGSSGALRLFFHSLNASHDI